MKDKNPPNPSPLPEHLNLSSDTGAMHEPASENNPKARRPRSRKPGVKSTHARRAGNRASRDNGESRWNRIKGRLAAKVAQVDQEKLHEVLLGCGVAVGIVASVVLAVKLMPLATLILAFLGLALALRLWGLLPFMPGPY